MGIGNRPGHRARAGRRLSGTRGWLVLAAIAATASPAAGQDEPVLDPTQINETINRLMREVEDGSAGEPADATQDVFNPAPAPAEPGQDESSLGEFGQGAAQPEPATPSGRAPNAVFQGEVTVDEFDLVDLHVNNEDLGTVLRLLSMQSRRNIITSRNAFASVTADLYGVTFFEALDAILHINGFGYREEGQFIYVYTREELDGLEAEARSLGSRVIELNYLNSADAARFAEPLLSPDGSITTPEPSEVFEIPDTGPVGRDEYANEARLVIHDYPENIAEIASLVARIDTRPSQVLVEATILQAAINEENAFGIDFSLIGDLDFVDLLNPLAAANSVINGQGAEAPIPGLDQEARAITSTVGNTTGKGSLKIGITDQDVAVFMRVLDEVTDVTVISNPKVLTLNRQPARVLVGTRVGYLNTTTTQTTSTQSVQFLDTGTQLHIRPFVTSDGLIRMEVKPQVSTASLRESSTGTGQAVTIPDEDTTELVTNLLVRDGQTVVLGGLFTENTSYTRRQVPVLGDIPLIGAAFRGQDDLVGRNEIIFMITPTVVDDAVLTLEGERANDFVEHSRVGAREGLLPWSRERQVGRLLIEAEELSDAGDVQRAMLKVQRALALAPQSPDAWRLRERLTAEGVSWPSRSILDDIFRRENGELTEHPAGIEPFPAIDPGEGADLGEAEPEPAATEITVVPVDEEGSE